jgi:hypothetical protein
MKRTLLIAIALLVAGCVRPPSTSDTPNEPTPTPTTSGTLNGSAPPQAPSVTVEFGASPTTSDSIPLFVNTSAPVLIVVEESGNETLRATVDASEVRSAPLTFGHNDFVVTVSAPGFQQRITKTIVRLASTRLDIDYGVFHPAAHGMPRSEGFDLWIDVDARPSAPAYAAQGIANMDGFSAHDQLVVFEQLTGKKVVVEYFPSFQGFGVNKIDGAGSPVSSDAPPWWCYTVNGESADGISIQPVAPGDVVAWTLGSCT